MEFIDCGQRKPGQMMLAIQSYEAVILQIELILFKFISGDSCEYLPALSTFGHVINELGGRIKENSIYDIIVANHIMAFPVEMINDLFKELNAINEVWDEKKAGEKFNSKFHKIAQIKEAILILNTPGHEITVLPPEVLRNVKSKKV